MPFTVLSLGVESLPQGSTLGPVSVLGGAVQIEQSPTADASGGVLNVVGYDPRDQLEVAYTAADGTVTQGVVILGGFRNAQGFDTEPVVYGGMLESFVVIEDSAEFIGEGGIEYFNFQKGHVITPTADGFDVRSLFGSLSEFQTNGPEEITTFLTPLGDGRVSFVFQKDGSTSKQSGVLAEVEGVDVVLNISGDAFLATDDGGLVVIDETGPGLYAIRQYNDDYQRLETHDVDSAALLAGSGLAIDDPVLSFVINDDGELDVFMSDPANPTGSAYRVVYDLVDFDPNVTTATEFGDVLILSQGDDVIDILPGTDTVFGLEGDDTISEMPRPGNGRTTDRDVVYGGDGDDTVRLTDGRDLIFGGNGDDLLDGGDSTYTSSTQRSGNTIYGDAGNDMLFGGAKRDQLFGGDDDDRIFGGEDDDLIEGGNGNDSILGDAGNDSIQGGVGRDRIDGGAGDDAIEASGEGSTVYGASGNDTLFTDARGVTLFGGDGDDEIETFGDGNTLYGGRGADTIDAVSVGAVVRGGLDEDTIQLFGANSKVYGGDGDDFIRMNSGRGSSAFGDQGSDSIVGSVNGDFIDGGAGDDWVTARYSVDRVLVEEGGLYGGFGNDTIYGRGGKDYLVGGEGDDDLRGGAGNDEDDQLGIGGGLKGGAGDDFIRGNHGDDDMFGSDGNDDMNGGFGDDLVTGGRGDDKIAGYDGNDLMRGGDGNDVISGGRGNDSLDGGAGDDIMRGGDGRDLLIVGRGNDVLYGGEGRDTYLTSLSELETEVTIKDFDVAQDKLFFALEGNGLTLDDIFLSTEDSAAVLEIENVRIRLEKVQIDDLSELDIF